MDRLMKRQEKDDSSLMEFFEEGLLICSKPLIHDGICSLKVGI